MEKKNIVFTVNGVEQKIEAKLVNEVFENEDGTRTSKWHSGRTVITDKFYGDRWLHKKMFDKEGQLSSELTRTFDDSGNLISICEDRADGGRDCTLYEYDDKNHCVYQKQKTLHPDGSTRLYERWFKNFSDEEEFDESKFIFDKEMCYRKLDKNGRVICFVDSCSSHENEYDANGGLTCATNKKAGRIICKIIYYKSDDGMVEIQKSENFEDKAIYYEIKDSRKTPENPDRLYTLYMPTEKNVVFCYSSFKLLSGGKMATIRPYGFLSEEEKATMPKISIKLIRRMTSYLKPFLIPLGFMFILTAVSSSVSLVPQIISKNIVDDALLGKNMKLLILLLGASLGFAVLNFFINNLCSYFKRKVNWKLSIHLKTQLFNKLVSMDHDFFKNEKQSDIKERLTVDVSDVVDSILEILPEIISSLAVFVTAFTVIGRTVDWRLIITGLAIFPLEILPKRLNNQKSFNKREKMREMNKNGSHFVDENLCVNGSLLMKLFTKEKSISEQYAKIHQERYELSNKTHKEGNFFKLLILILSKINSLLVYFVAGYLMIVQKNDAISVGSITMTIALCSRLTRPVNMLLNSHSEMLRGFAAFNRIIGYLDKENKIVPPVDGVNEKVCDGDIEFSHVDFSYTEDAPLLKDVSFKLPAGKCFALVGPSGAGKSSIINLIPRLYDATGGSITFDGVNIKDIDLEYLRSNIGVVTQDTFLFNGTILENLKYAKEDATQEEIEEACKNANIHDFIVSQPDGYESLVGNGGLKLSGGERQRIAIARVLLKNPKILILDEATSALDSINEAAIQNSLDRLLVGRTSIIIAHRLSTILKADNIMVLKEGQIVEQGTHKELIELNGTYRELYDTQFKKVLNSGKKEFGQIYKVQKLDNEFSK